MTRPAPAMRRHWALLAAGALFALAGALTLETYGNWVDAPNQRAVGNAALDYLAGDGERAFDQLFVPEDRYYGAVFELPGAIVERLLDLDDGRGLHLSRHVLMHLFFLAGGVFCYLLVLRLFDNRPLAVAAMILFLLHPRLYAHSFVNSKDLPLLAAFMIALFLAHRAFRRDTLGAFILCGAGMGLLVNLRIMGVILFAAVLALRALDLALAGRADERGRILLTGGAFALAAMLTYYASLPVLWTDPFGRFVEMTGALRSDLHAPIHLFRGEWLRSGDGPSWDYVPVWVGITTPPATLLLALAGAVALAWRAARRPRDALRTGPLRFGLLLAALPIATVAAVVVLESNLHSGWRHLSFLYAPLLLLAVFGLRGTLAAARGRWMRAGAYALAGAAIAVTAAAMVRIHPYQGSYFNALTDRTTPERPASRYAMGYGGVWSTLAAIAEEHPGRIFVNDSFRVSSSFGGGRLAPDERERITVTRDFRSGERNFFALPSPEACPLASAPPFAVARVYAATIWCVVDPVAWFGDLRRGARAAEPAVRAVYDVWRRGRFLIYARDGCPPDDIAEGGPRFFLHAVPVDAGDLPPGSREYGFQNLDQAPRAGAARIDGNCVALARLPAYPIASIRTGQLSGDGVLWEAEIAFGEAEAAPDYAAARRQALAKEPLARSGYDVHVHRDGRTLTYLRDGCTDADADARFFLHVFPADMGDLPERRREHGFDNLDFMLETRGARIDGNCVAVARLPAYPVATVRTGQYDATGALWTAEFTLPDGE